MSPHLIPEEDDGYGCGHPLDAHVAEHGEEAAPVRVDEWSKREGHLVLDMHGERHTVVPHENGRTDGRLLGPLRAYGPEEYRRYAHLIAQGKAGALQLVRMPTKAELDTNGNIRPDAISPYFADLQRVLPSAEIQRMGGVLQMLPGAGMANRRSHGWDTASVGVGMALGLGLDPDLVLAAAANHDIGHPPFGHSGEDGMTMQFGQLASHRGQEFNHSLAGLRKARRDLGMHEDIVEAIGLHSWQLPRGSRAECDIVSLADRVAYVGSDLVDFVKAGQVRWEDIPHQIPLAFELAEIDAREFERIGSAPDRYEALKAGIYDGFVRDVVAQGRLTNRVGLSVHGAAALSQARNFNASHLFSHEPHKRWQRYMVQTMERLSGELLRTFDSSPLLISVDRGRPLSVDGRRKRVIGRIMAMTDIEAAQAARQVLGVEPGMLLGGPSMHDTRSTVPMSSSRRPRTAAVERGAAVGRRVELPSLTRLLPRVPVPESLGGTGTFTATALLDALDLARQAIEPQVTTAPTGPRRPRTGEIGGRRLATAQVPRLHRSEPQVWESVAVPSPMDSRNALAVEVLQEALGAAVHGALTDGAPKPQGGYVTPLSEGRRSLEARIRAELGAPTTVALLDLRPAGTDLGSRRASEAFDAAAERAVRSYAMDVSLQGHAPAHELTFGRMQRHIGPVGAIR
jgi:dGTP triphosphohydrolase